MAEAQLCHGTIPSCLQRHRTRQCQSAGLRLDSGWVCLHEGDGDPCYKQSQQACSSSGAEQWAWGSLSALPATVQLHRWVQAEESFASNTPRALDPQRGTQICDVIAVLCFHPCCKE